MERDKIFMGILVAILIFLSVTLYIVVIDKGQVTSGNWSLSLENASMMPGWGMYVDHDGTFYTVADRELYAIGVDGATLWKAPITSEWLHNHTRFFLYTARSEGDRLFTIVTPDPGTETTDLNRGLLMAIDGDGNVLWQVPVDGIYGYPMLQLLLSGEQIYLYHSGSVRVYDRQGTLLWSVGNVYFGPALRPDGVIYLTNSSDPNAHDPSKRWTVSIDAYFPNGSLYWSHDGDEYWGKEIRDYLSDIPEPLYSLQFCIAPDLIYQNGTLYAKHVLGLTALDDDGTLRWSLPFKGTRDFIGFGREDQMYLAGYDYGNESGYSIVVTPDGKMSENRFQGEAMFYGSLKGRTEDIAYFVTEGQSREHRDPGILDNFTVSAYDLDNGSLLWSYIIRPVHPRTTTLNSTSAGAVLAWSDLDDARKVNYVDQWVWYESKGIPQGTHEIKGNIFTNMIVSDTTVYFSYWAYSYEYPMFFDSANCRYAGGLYAIDGSGRLIWYRDTDSYVTSMTARNGTIYYQINGGRFSAVSTDMAAGFAFAAFYLFFRFFLLGAVSRARSRLDKNANRNMVLAFVAENPGVSLYEIARALRMNVGTVRYHLLILSINHKVSAAGSSPKSVGYFACSRLYSDEEKLLMPLMRKGQISELLSILSSQPGLSNAEVAANLGLAESAVSRYMLELNRRGVVSRRRAENGKLTYCVEDKFLPALSDFLSDSQPGCYRRNSVQETPAAEASR